MPEYLAPGVYVEEVDTGSKPIEGVSTSTAGMLGVAERGPVNVPILITGLAEYRRWFGERLSIAQFSAGAERHCDLPYAVEGFFSNGGKRVYITRVAAAAAAHAILESFDRGRATSAGTMLLRDAGAGTGTQVGRPLLYVLDPTNLNVNAANPALSDWVRVGDGSGAEYHQLATVGAAATNTHVPLNFPLRLAHARGVTAVRQIARAVDTTYPAGAQQGTFALANPAPAGSRRLVLTGTAGDITQLLAAADQLVEVGPPGTGEHHRVTTAAGVTATRARVELAAPLALDYAANAPVVALEIGATIQAATLEVDAGVGDQMIFVDDRNGALNVPADLVVIELAAGTAAVIAASREVRRIGALRELELGRAAYEDYPAGALVQHVAVGDDDRTVTALNPVAADPTIIDLDDVTALVPGQDVLLDPGPTEEILVVRSVDAAASRVTFTSAPANAHGAAPAVRLAPKRLTAAAAPGSLTLSLGNRLGIMADDVLRVGVAPDDEYVTVAAVAGARGNPPDAGAVVLTHPLRHPQATAAEVRRQVVSAPVPQHPPAFITLPAAAGGTTLLVNDGQSYAAGEFVAVGPPAGGRYIHRITGVDAVAPVEVELATALDRNHSAGAVLAERAALLRVEALDSGAWGNRLRISVADEEAGLVSGSTLSGFVGGTGIRLSSATGVEPGTLLELVGPGTPAAAVNPPLKVRAIDRTQNNLILLDPPGLTPEQQQAHAAAVLANTALQIRSREFRFTVRLLRQPDPAVPVRDDQELDIEAFDHLSMDPRHSRYIETIIGRIPDPGIPLRLSDQRTEGESWYVRLADLAPPADRQAARLGPEALVDVLRDGRRVPARRALGGGTDAILTLTDGDYIGLDAPEPENRTGLHSLRNVEEISLIACPGRTSLQLQEALITQCELMRYRFAVLDGTRPPADTLADVRAQRQRYDTRYAALYHPWLLIPDPFPPTLAALREYAIPPSGHILGVIARTDIERGVHKAPANEVVRGVIGLRRLLNKGEHDILNPYPVNINVIRDFRANNRGIRVYGGRVITSDSDWKYVNVRRLLIFIEASIDRGLQWVVFEPNAEPLWARVRRTISDFLTVVWRNGALEGTKSEEAFYVKCDRTTMTQTDIDSGRLIVLIGVAPVKPAEFVIIRIGLWTAHATT